MCRTALSLLFVASYGLAMGLAGAQEGEEIQEEFIEVLDRTPEDCMPLSRIRRTRIVDDETILFYTRSRDVFLNILPRDCPGLERSGRFMYAPFSNRLCDTDTITVLDRFAGRFERGATCRLGSFVPISEIEAEEMLDAADETRRGGRARVQVEPAELPEDVDEDVDETVDEAVDEPVDAGDVD